MLRRALCHGSRGGLQRRGGMGLQERMRFRDATSFQRAQRGLHFVHLLRATSGDPMCFLLRHQSLLDFQQALLHFDAPREKHRAAVAPKGAQTTQFCAQWGQLQCRSTY
jgi:hypothetical protein